MTTTEPKWQFSLRSLFIAVFACAVVAGLWKTLGTSTFMDVAFVPVSLLPILGMTGQQRSSYADSWLTVYGPFIVMATYTLLYVSCSHCKQATWEVLPYAPGTIPVELGRHLLDLPRFSSAIEIVLAALISAGMVVGLTWAVLRGRLWWKALCVTIGLLVCGYCALVVLAITRA